MIVLAVVAMVFSVVAGPLAPARAANTMEFWGSENKAPAPTKMTADLDKLDTYYTTSPHELKVGDAKRVLETSFKYKELYDADPAMYPSLASFFEWLQQFGRAEVRGTMRARTIQAMTLKAENDAKAAIKNNIDQYIQKLQEAKNDPTADKDRIDALVENLNKLKDDPNFDPTSEDVVANIKAAKEIGNNPSAKPDVPGYTGNVPTEDKTQAINDLQAKAEALRALLAAHPEDSADLSADERKAAQDQLAKANAALENPNGYSASQLTALANETQAATDTAKKAVDDNRAAARTDLDNSLTSANALFNDPSLLDADKAALKEKIDAAQRVSDNQDATTQALKDAKATLDQAIKDAQAARDAAIAKAKSDLSSEVGAAETALSDPNISEADKAALREAIDAAKDEVNKSDATVPSLTEKSDALKEALNKAKGDALNRAVEALKSAKEELARNLGLHNDPANQNLTPAQADEADSKVKTAENILEAVKANPSAFTPERINEAVQAVKAANDKLAAEVAANKAAANKAIVDQANADKDFADKNADLSNNSKAAIEALAGEATTHAQQHSGDTVHDQNNYLSNYRDRVNAIIAENAKAAEIQKARLQEAIDALKALRDANTDNENLTADDVKALNDAITAAETAKARNNPDELAAAVKAAQEALSKGNQAIAANKASAVGGLEASVNALKKYLEANPVDTENLTPAERKTAQDALEKAQADLMKAKVGNLSVSQINKAKDDADTALQNAKDAVKQNQDDERVNLKGTIDRATELSKDTNLPEGAKNTLLAAVAKAQAVYDNPNATVADLKKAGQDLEGAITAANQAKDDALAGAKSDLDKNIEKLEALLNGNPADTRNLTDAEREAAQNAFEKAKVIRDNADGKSLAELQDAAKAVSVATDKAAAEITANKEAARDALAKELALADALKDVEMDDQTKADLLKAIKDATKVKENGNATVKDLEDALTAVKDAEDAATKAAQNVKDAETVKLDAAIKELEKALAANDESTENLTDEQRAAAQDALTNAQAMRAIVNDPEYGLSAAEIRELTETTLAAAKQVGDDAAANKTPHRQALNAAADELEKFLAANPEASKNLKPEQFAAAKAVLDDAKKLAAADASTVAQLKASLKAVQDALTAGKQQVADNKAATKEAMAKALEAAKARVASGKLTAASRDALAKAIAAAEALGEDATVADLEAATIALDQGVEEANGALAKTGANLTALPLALAMILTGTVLVRRRKRA